MSCNICCDTYNMSTRAKVNCSYCDFGACRTCCETYVLSESVPKCLNSKCNKEWSRKFIREKFTSVFVNKKFKKHIEDILYEQEKALMPATQPIIEEMNRKKHIREELSKLDEEIAKLARERRLLEATIYNPNLDKTKETQKTSFMRSCAAEGCRGFLSSQWKCGICELWTCPDCHELKGENRDDPDHKCDPNNVETAKLLNKDTKPCPKCQTKIFKIDGCDQMWCTQCHTAFSWKTGAISTSIHNPHYFEWMRNRGGGEQPRAAGDIICGQELTHHATNQITDLIKNKKHTNLCQSIEKQAYYRDGVYITCTKNMRDFLEMIRQIIHIRHVEMPRFRIDHFNKNQELRVKYLCNEISEEELKIQVQRNDKKNRKQTEILNILTLLETMVTDIVYRVIDDLRKSAQNEHQFDEIVKEINVSKEYCNNIFKEVAFTYNCVCYYLDENFYLRTYKLEKPNKKKKSKGGGGVPDSDSDSDGDNDVQAE